MRLERIDPTHQQVEQLVARGAIGWCFGKRRLIRQSTESQQNGGTAWEALASARQWQFGRAGSVRDR
jgi:hypothetical protein